MFVNCRQRHGRCLSSRISVLCLQCHLTCTQRLRKQYFWVVAPLCQADCRSELKLASSAETFAAFPLGGFFGFASTIGEGCVPPPVCFGHAMICGNVRLCVVRTSHPRHRRARASLLPCAWPYFWHGSQLSPHNMPIIRRPTMPFLQAHDNMRRRRVCRKVAPLRFAARAHGVGRTTGFKFGLSRPSPFFVMVLQSLHQNS
mmetsp:Transcript_4439/g.13446  ORF Transcript_4439/g.13446 Transcript_4439/m.13446 type:complete len:201 (-) Transcript_4439:268-870(-)